MASNQDDAGSTPAWRSILQGTKRHDAEAQTKTEESVVNCLWGVMAAWRTFNPFGRGSIPRRGTRLLSFNGIGHRPSKPRIWVQIPAGAPYSRGPRDGRPTYESSLRRLDSCREFHSPVAEGNRRSIPNRDHARSSRARASSFVEGSSNGRTAGSDPANLGSNPSPSTNFQNR